MYVCGPTVYDVGHLGHARSAVSFDVIRRYFLYKGWKVTFVSNITDVDDKMIKRAAEEGVTEIELAARIIPEYEKDYGALKILTPDFQPRATEYIGKMVKFIEELVKKGAAYKTDDGIYFEVGTFKEYGKLSHQKLEELQAGARVVVDEKKKNPEDFALWKAAKPGEPQWPGPLGISGRPGWHIECSAMSVSILGQTFDIHGGGIDLMFPHHEDEIAQSETVTGKPFAKYWLHNGHIMVKKEKMSKSLGNFFTIKEILAKYNPLVVRYFLLSSHYRMPVDFTHDLLEQSKQSLSRLQDCFRNLKAAINILKDGVHDGVKITHAAEKAFDEAMDDDFEISRGLAAIFDLINVVNARMHEGTLTKSQAEEVIVFLRKIDGILKVIETEQEILPEQIEKLIEERIAARASKDFKKADEIRKNLEAQGIILEDTKNGTIWKRAL